MGIPVLTVGANPGHRAAPSLPQSGTLLGVIRKIPPPPLLTALQATLICKIVNWESFDCLLTTSS